MNWRKKKERTTTDGGRYTRTCGAGAAATNRDQSGSDRLSKPKAEEGRQNVRALVLCPDRCKALEQGNRGRLDRDAKGLVTKQERTRCWRDV
jgi:hypothetical protein